METHIEPLLTTLISTGSPYPEEMALQEFIAGLMLKNGYRIQVQHVEDGRANILVEKGKGKRTVLLYSHLDTVPVAAGWKGDPLHPRVAGDRLYGLGAFDMKGGMAVNIDTFFQYEPKHYKLRLLFCVDEEYISRGGHVFAASPLMRETDIVLSPEPAFAHGENGIVTGRIGRAVIVIRLERASEHFYYYTPDRDISLVASKIILRLQRVFHEKNGKKEFVFVRSMHAQSAGMSTPQEVTLELDTSILPPQTPDTMLARVQKTVRDITGTRNDITCTVSFKERPTPFLAGYELDTGDRHLAVMEKVIKKVTGKKAAPYFRSSVADENIFGAMGKTVLGVGPAGGNAHGANEWVSLSSLNRLRKIYGSFLQAIDTPS